MGNAACQTLQVIHIHDDDLVFANQFHMMRIFLIEIKSCDCTGTVIEKIQDLVTLIVQLIASCIKT
jgi:hypothetical protein